MISCCVCGVFRHAGGVGHHWDKGQLQMLMVYTFHLNGCQKLQQSPSAGSLIVEESFKLHPKVNGLTKPASVCN